MNRSFDSPQEVMSSLKRNLRIHTTLQPVRMVWCAPLGGPTVLIRSSWAGERNFAGQKDAKARLALALTG